MMSFSGSYEGRQVEVRSDSKSPFAEPLRATFVRWADDFTELKSGPAQYTSALLDVNGQIISVHPDRITFIPDSSLVRLFCFLKKLLFKPIKEQNHA